MAGSKFDSKSFNPQAFGLYVDRIPQLKKNALLTSGVLKRNPEIKNNFSKQTTTLHSVVPMYGLLDGEPLNYDGETDIEATNTKTYERGIHSLGRAKAWTEMDFSEDITGGAGFMDNVANQVSQFWESIDQEIILSILKGIFSMTGAKNLEFVNNHTYDITSSGDGFVGADTLNTAIQKACGDNKNNFTFVAMHSAVATHLENLNLLSYLKQTDSFGIQRDLTLATWNGRSVLIDDGLPTEIVKASGDVSEHTKYTTYILGKGAIDYEDIGAKVPYEMQRDPKKNGGLDILYTRMRKVFAPFGISYTKKNQATASPTNAELEDGANWELVNTGGTGSAKEYINHRSIPIARIISKG